LVAELGRGELGKRTGLGVSERRGRTEEEIETKIADIKKAAVEEYCMIMHR
jgi:hypothetical protein